jgi:hypothetical protein
MMNFFGFFLYGMCWGGKGRGGRGVHEAGNREKTHQRGSKYVRALK